MSTFAESLKIHLQAKQGKNAKEKRLLAMLEEPDSPRKDRRVNRMERRVRHELGFGETEAVDWGNLPWADILALVLRVLAALLPFLLAL